MPIVEVEKGDEMPPPKHKLCLVEVEYKHKLVAERQLDSISCPITLVQPA